MSKRRKIPWQAYVYDYARLVRHVVTTRIPELVGMAIAVVLLLTCSCSCSCASLRSYACESRGGTAYRWMPRWQTCTTFAGAVVCDRPSTYQGFAGCSL